ncbi:unnamed protein product [Symbiodinium microadriaticum]|nr:unnamed protein product [Symbiodinium microadriaticum]CAE7943081.1 unnamed protein product [Symbiodinium sp. KB8]
MLRCLSKFHRCSAHLPRDHLPPGVERSREHCPADARAAPSPATLATYRSGIR